MRLNCSFVKASYLEKRVSSLKGAKRYVPGIEYCKAADWTHNMQHICEHLKFYSHHFITVESYDSTVDIVFKHNQMFWSVRDDSVKLSKPRTMLRLIFFTKKSSSIINWLFEYNILSCDETAILLLRL